MRKICDLNNSGTFADFRCKKARNHGDCGGSVKVFYLPLNSVNFCFDRMTRKFSKKCQFCPPKIQCFCGLPQFEKPNISQFFPSVLSKWFGNDFRIDIWRVVRVVEGAALEMLCPERDLGFESLTLRQKVQ